MGMGEEVGDKREGKVYKGLMVFEETWLYGA